MRVLTISRNGLELARTHMHRPLATIGRSPTCDVVLRASGVAPVHFLLEWVGAGEFNPSEGAWSIFDISSSADQSGEGALLTDEAEFGSFKFKWVVDTLENQPDIGGSIRAELNPETHEAASMRTPPLVEVVQVRTDSGAIEEVLHLDSRFVRKVRRPLDAIPEFKLGRATKSDVIQILLEEMPGALIYLKGLPGASRKTCPIDRADLVEVRWKDYNFYLRLVDRVPKPKVTVKEKRDPLLFKISAAAAAISAFLLLIAVLVISHKTEEPPAPPPRVATVEIKEVIPPKPEVQPPPPQPEETKPESAAKVEKAAPKKTKQAAIPVEKPKAKNEMASSRFKPKPSADKSKAAGLNAPVKKADVNQIGLLGDLQASTPKGPGVKADMVLNEGVISKAVTNNDDNAKVSLMVSPSGTLGTGKSGGSKSGSSNLAQATTTLKGGGDLDSNSISPISGGHGSGFSSSGKIGGGSGTGNGIGGGSDSTGMGDDLTGPQVSGGLDRETVRRIIKQYRGEIRTCYEKSLLSNPSLAGRIVYNWKISPQGPVVTAKVMRSTAGSPALEKCVNDVIMIMKFPAAANGKSTTVIYPFVFQARS